MTEQLERRRAYSYLTRRKTGRTQVAVFRHPGFEKMMLGDQVHGSIT